MGDTQRRVGDGESIEDFLSSLERLAVAGASARSQLGDLIECDEYRRAILRVALEADDEATSVARLSATI